MGRLPHQRLAAGLCLVLAAVSALDAAAVASHSPPVEPHQCSSPADLPIEGGRTHADMVAGDQERLWVSVWLCGASSAALGVALAVQHWEPLRRAHQAAGALATVASFNVAIGAVVLERAGLVYSLPKNHALAPVVASNGVWLRSAALAAYAAVSLWRGAAPSAATTDAQWAAGLRLAAAALVDLTARFAMAGAVLLVRLLSSPARWCEPDAARQLFGVVYWAALAWNLVLAELLIASHRADVIIRGRMASVGDALVELRRRRASGEKEE